jgi:hypothetical protein
VQVYDADEEVIGPGLRAVVGDRPPRRMLPLRLFLKLYSRLKLKLHEARKAAAAAQVCLQCYACSLMWSCGPGKAQEARGSVQVVAVALQAPCLWRWHAT